MNGHDRDQQSIDTNSTNLSKQHSSSESYLARIRDETKRLRQKKRETRSHSVSSRESPVKPKQQERRPPPDSVNPNNISLAESSFDDSLGEIIDDNGAEEVSLSEYQVFVNGGNHNNNGTDANASERYQESFSQSRHDESSSLAKQPGGGFFFRKFSRMETYDSQKEREAFRNKLIDEVLGKESGEKVPMEKVMMIIWQFRDDKEVIKFMTRFVSKVCCATQGELLDHQARRKSCAHTIRACIHACLVWICCRFYFFVCAS